MLSTIIKKKKTEEFKQTAKIDSAKIKELKQFLEFGKTNFLQQEKLGMNPNQHRAIQIETDYIAIFKQKTICRAI